MKYIVLIFTIFYFQYFFSQIISGDIYSSGRRILTETNFSINSPKKGEIVFDLSVDIYGKVTSAVVVKSMTSITSTPMVMDAKNLVSTYRFEPGNGFPKFHHGLVRINFIEK